MKTKTHADLFYLLQLIWKDYSITSHYKAILSKGLQIAFSVIAQYFAGGKRCGRTIL